MNDIALYYPYVDFRDEAWLKAAVLHWPKLALIDAGDRDWRPESDTVRRLRDELDFILDVEAGARDADSLDSLMYEFLDRHLDALLPRYGLRAMGVESPSERYSDMVVDGPLLEIEHVDPRLERIYPSKLSWVLANDLADAGLVMRLNYMWRRPNDGKEIYVSELGMHRRLAMVYVTALAADLAQNNQLATITDQPVPQAAVAGWTVDRLAELLLDDETQSTAPVDGDLAQAFAIVALHTVLPRGLGDVPISRIVEARKHLLPDLVAYRNYLDSLSTELVELAKMSDREIRTARLQLMVDTEVSQRIARMEREIGRLGLQPVRAVLSAQSLAPPALLGALANTVDLPAAVTMAGVAATCLVGASATALSKRAQTWQSHPTGYLLALKRELTPGEAVARTRRAFRRVTGGRR